MLKTLLAAAAMAIVATAASAQNVRPAFLPAGYGQAAGDLAISGGTLNLSSTGVTLFSTAGRANLPVNANWNLELEANAKAYIVGGISALPISVDGYLHAWTAMDHLAWGVFGGATHLLGMQATSFGGEFKHFMRNLSVGGAVAMTTIAGQTGWSANASANAYLTSNDRVGIKGAWMSIGSGSIWEVSVDAEHRFAQPASLFVQAATQGTSSGSTPNIYYVLGGLRIYMDGAGSTQQTHEGQVPFSFNLPLLLSP